MLNVDEYKQIINSNNRRDTVDEARKYSEHFDYDDLYSRLLKVKL